MHFHCPLVYFGLSNKCILELSLSALSNNLHTHGMILVATLRKRLLAFVIARQANVRLLSCVDCVQPVFS